MKKKMFVTVFICFAAVNALLFAHTPLLTVEDNGDGTIFVQGGFSNGASAGGVKLYLKDAATGEKLYEGVFPDIGETDLDIPAVPYTVVFDAGPGHIVEKDGPPPPGGFGAAKKTENASNSSASQEPSGKSSVSESASEGQAKVLSADWTPSDTAAVMPKYGVSYVSLIAMIMSCINTVLLLFILRKRR